MQRAIFTFFAIVALTAPAAAQQLTLRIQDGRVDLDATSVPVRQILAEWARVGGTKVINGERVAGAPLTLKLVDVPERQALEVVLRNVAGYMAAPRSATATPGASVYDRIMVLPTSAAPAASANAARPQPQPPASDPRAGLQRFVPPRPPVRNGQASEGEDEEVEAIEEEPAADDEPPAQSPAVFTFPQPGQAMPGQSTPPGGTFVPVQPNPVNPGVSSQPPAAVPGMGSPVPGVITNPQPAPTTPGARPTRPPGSDD